MQCMRMINACHYKALKHGWERERRNVYGIPLPGFHARASSEYIFFIVFCFESDDNDM